MPGNSQHASANGVTASKKLVQVLEITRALTSEVNLDALLGKITNAATDLLDAERATLYLVDRQSGDLLSKVAQRVGGGGIRVARGTGLAGHVAATGEAVLVPDVTLDPRFQSRYDAKTGFRTRDMIAVPIWNSRHECIGVLQVLNHRGDAFGAADLPLIEALASSAGVALENARLYEQLDTMLQSVVRTLAASIDARDPQTAGHSQRVAGYAGKLAAEIGIPPLHQKLIYLSGLLHDYGKIGVPEAILTKPGKLSDGEMDVMRQHATMSREILLNVEFTEELNRIPEIVYQHHERIDGGGYPRGLSGADISLEGRILAVCDVFDALTQRRYYREPITHAEAFEYIHDNRGTHFDTEIALAWGSIVARGESASVDVWVPEGVVAAAAEARQDGTEAFLEQPA